MNNHLGPIDVEFLLNNREFRRNSNAVKNDIKGVSKTAKDEANSTTQTANKGLGSIKSVAGTLGGALAAAFSVQLLIDWQRKILDVTAEFQKMEAVLTNTLGSDSAAQLAMAQIVEFASKTPFQVDQLTDSYIRLTNQGFQPSVEELTKLGDLASSTGKDFGQLSEAIIDAQVGEFERLKEFGIRASKEGDNVTFTFKGVQEQVEFTEEAIRGYILSLGDAEGVSGAMAAISETVGGKMSNLGDNIDQLSLAIGDKQSGVYASTLDWLNDFISLATSAVKSTADIREEMRLLNGSESFDATNKEVDFLIKKLSQRMTMEEAINKAVDMTIQSYRDLSDNLDGDITTGKLWKQISELEKYRKQLMKDNAGASVETLGSLNKQLEKLEKQRLNIDITKTELLNDNLQKQLEIKKKIEAVDGKALENQKKSNKQIVNFSDQALLEEAEKLKNNLLSETGVFTEFQERLNKIGLQSMKNTGGKALDLQKDFYNQTERLTVNAAKILLQKAENELNSGAITSERADLLKRLIKELQLEINQIKLDNIYQLGMAMGDLGQSLVNLGDATQNSGLANIGGLLSGLASGLNDVLVAFDDEATDLDKIGAGVNGLVRMVDMLASAARRRQEAEAAYYRSIIGFQNDYNLSLQEQIRLESILGENVFLKDFEGRIKDGLSAISNANEEYQKAIQELGAGQAITGQRDAVDWGNVGQGASAGAAVGAAVGSVVPLIGTAIGTVVGGLAGALTGLFAGNKKEDELAPLLQEYPELVQQTESGMLKVNKELAEALMQNDLLSEGTKDLVQNVLDWEKALESAREQVKGVISELAGSLGSGLRNDLVEAFEAGEDAARRMGDTVEEVLENILSQLLFNRIFSDNFDQLEKQMAASMDVGGDQSWTDDLGRFFQGFQNEVDTFNKGMKDAQKEAEKFGFDLFSPNGSSSQASPLTGGIQRLSEQTGTELAGLFRGFYDISKRGVQLNETRFDVEKKHYDATLNIMRSNAAIELNTGQTVIKLTEAVTELKAIRKGGAGNRNIGYD